MIRQLLALIALITGLAAVAEPAQARMAAMETVGQAETRDAGCQIGLTAPFLSRPWLGRLDTPKICPRPQIVIIVPPVMLQADRAHE